MPRLLAEGVTVGGRTGSAQAIGPGRLIAIRVVALLSLTAGTSYVVWRWVWSVNWDNWWIAVPLVVAETYALIDGYLFAATVWRTKQRGEAPPPPADATVDVLITTYNEPIDMVMTTARAAAAIHYPHRTYILDDGARAELRSAAITAGIGYVTRSADWKDRPRHAKAGNLNNALLQTDGEFLLILDADQIPHPEILDRTLGWFEDPEMALVQTPQWFSNVTESDPLGSQAPLFYGPIQQGKDGWNAAFFCGSNAVIRREALMQLGITGYVREVESAVRSALRTAGRILDRTARRERKQSPEVAHAVRHVRAGVTRALEELRRGAPVAEVTYGFQSVMREASRSLVDRDLDAIHADLAEMGIDLATDLGVELDTELRLPVVDETALDRLASRDWGPLAALESIEQLMRAVDVDRGDEAQPLMPMATVSVTEDMATCMRLHAAGWKSAYHHEVLATGLAPDDLGTMLTQRLRWAQGTLQVLLRENPLTKRGLDTGQRTMYFATMWSYLAGFAALPFLLAPVFYLCFGALPVYAYGLTFLAFFTPYFLLNQLLFALVGYGVKTWRGHQYSLVLFPVWIKACISAAANVWFGRPLGFAVTPKERSSGRRPFPFRLLWPQLTIMALLVIAVVVGCLRLWWGDTLTGVGLGVNTLWVAYDLVVFSVIFQAARYSPPPPPPPPSSYRLDGPVRADGLDLVQNLVAQMRSEHGDLDPAALMLFEIALAEVAGNVVEHASEGGAHRWTVELALGGGRLTGTITDDGRAFTGDIGSDLPEELEVSGRGLALARTSVDEVTYARLGERNQWQLVQSLPDPPPSPLASADAPTADQHDDPPRPPDDQREEEA